MNGILIVTASVGLIFITWACSSFYYTGNIISPLLFFRDQRFVRLKIIHLSTLRLMAKGKSESEISAILRNFHLPYVGRDGPVSSFVKKVLKDKELLSMYIIQQKFEYSDFRDLLRHTSKTEVQQQIIFKLKGILVNESNENVKGMIHVLVELHTKPFVAEQQLGISISKGMNEISMYHAMLNMGILKCGCTLIDYGFILMSLSKIYPEMEILRGRSTLYYQIDNVKSFEHNFKELVRINQQFIRTLTDDSGVIEDKSEYLSESPKFCPKVQKVVRKVVRKIGCKMKSI